jgi:hypothetical protein
MCFDIVFQYPAQGRAFCGLSGGASTTLDGPPCAEPGDSGNELGVGKHCTEGGGECASTSGANLCLADYVSGDFGNFCAASCSSDDDCGSGATCMGSGARAVCFPDQCVDTVTVTEGADAGPAAAD